MTPSPIPSVLKQGNELTSTRIHRLDVLRLSCRIPMSKIHFEPWSIQQILRPNSGMLAMILEIAGDTPNNLRRDIGSIMHIHQAVLQRRCIEHDLDRVLSSV